MLEPTATNRIIWRALRTRQAVRIPVAAADRDDLRGARRRLAEEGPDRGASHRPDVLLVLEKDTEGVVHQLGRQAGRAQGQQR